MDSILSSRKDKTKKKREKKERKEKKECVKSFLWTQNQPRSIYYEFSLNVGLYSQEGEAGEKGEEGEKTEGERGKGEREEGERGKGEREEGQRRGVGLVDYYPLTHKIQGFDCSENT